MTINWRLVALLAPGIVMLCTVAVPRSEAQSQAQQNLAGRFIQHAVAYCGYEPSLEGEALRIKDFGPDHARDRQFADDLWRGTFACEAAYIGTSCMAARLGLCQRTFAEYGPEGVVLPGLLKPIIRK